MFLRKICLRATVSCEHHSSLEIPVQPIHRNGWAENNDTRRGSEVILGGVPPLPWTLSLAHLSSFDSSHPSSAITPCCLAMLDQSVCWHFDQSPLSYFCSSSHHLAHSRFLRISLITSYLWGITTKIIVSSVCGFRLITVSSLEKQL